MDYFFKSIKGQDFLKSFKELIVAKKVAFKYVKPFVFVCGGHAENKKNNRSKFLDFSKNHNSKYEFILAEYAFNRLKANDSYEFVNIAQFEEVIAQVSSCILIFPESPGSFAEVGYFSSSPEIRKNTLIVKDIKHQDDSFLNIGPYDLIDGSSVFKNTIMLNLGSKRINFKSIIERLDSRITKSENSKSLNIKKFTELQMRERFFSLLVFVDLFGPISKKGLIEIINYTFGKEDILSYVNHFIAILLQLSFIEKKVIDDAFFYITNDTGREYVHYTFNKSEFRLGLFDYYRELKNDQLNEAMKCI